MLLVAALLLIGSVASTTEDGSCSKWKSEYQCTFTDPCSWRNAVTNPAGLSFSSCYWHRQTNQSYCQDAPPFCPLTRNSLEQNYGRRRRGGRSCTYQWNRDVNQATKKETTVWASDDKGMICVLQKDHYLVVDVRRYVQRPCMYMKATVQDRSLDQYHVWISLSSRCNISADSIAPCQADNSLAVIKAIAPSSRGDHDYYSCWQSELENSLSYYIDDDGSVTLRAGHVDCCPDGGRIGETRKIPIIVKLKFHEQDQVDESSVSGLELLQSCQNDSGRIEIVIRPPPEKSAGLVKYNYTLPALSCFAVSTGNNSQRSVSTKLTGEDTIVCSLSMPKTVVAVECLLSQSSALIEVTVSCHNEYPISHNISVQLIDAGSYHRRIPVLGVAYPGCSLAVSGRYRQNPDSGWRGIQEDYVFDVLDQVSDSNSFTLGLVYKTTIPFTAAVVLVFVVVLMYVRYRRKQDGVTVTLGLVEHMEITGTAMPPTEPALAQASPTIQSRSMTELTENQHSTQNNFRIACLFSELDEWVTTELFRRLESEEGVELIKYPLAGRPFSRSVAEQIKKSDRIIVVWSINYSKVAGSNYAISQAVFESILNDKVVIPIKLDALELPDEMRTLVHLKPNSTELWSRLMATDRM